MLGQRLLELFPSHRTNGLFDAYAQVAETAYPLRREFQFDENGVVGEFEVLICAMWRRRHRTWGTTSLVARTPSGG